MALAVAFPPPTMSVYSPRTIPSKLPDPGDVFTTDPRYGKSTDESHDANRPYFDVPPPRAEAKSHQKIPGRVVYRTISSIVGFKEGYSLLVFIIFAGALIGFSLYGARTMNFALMQKYAPPGQWFWFSQTTFKANYAIHIYTAVSELSTCILYQQAV
ncbi:hypothetical protein IW261DRAFT_919947 [Armillaria novae-zelandiae]|uniref:Uncharacterized protein n=1 Tax=Armillaria novae-zelandiae TaxID=153914 RepID=A0AA39NSM8_9AGAR|nr:hypothetical protein IW261DRAFT_919947 [Armillaria novae-zelandiae]